MAGKLTKAQAEKLLWSQVDQDQQEMLRIGNATHELAYRVGRVAARFALPTSRLEMEIAPTARELAVRLRQVASGLVEISLENLDDLELDWKRQRAIQKGCALPKNKPIEKEHPVIEVDMGTGLPRTTETALAELFVAGLECHRCGRELYFLARHFEMKVRTPEVIDAFLARRPTVKHLAWHIGETADGAHGHFVDFGRELIAASKAHRATSGTQWDSRRYGWDQDRTFA